MTLDVLYHEGPCIVVNKPSGLLTQAPAGIDSLEEHVRSYIKDLESKTGNIYVGVPHRLDRPASGAIVFGRHVRATRRLAKQFEERTIQKTYWAIVPRTKIPVEGIWRDRLRKIPGRSFVEVVEDDHPEGKSAVLRCQIRREMGDFNLLELELETGRTHQIRVQAAHRGIPILGDDQYGSTNSFGPHFDDPRDRAIALHARGLGLEHPMTRERFDVVAPLPSTWTDWPFLE